VEEARELKRQSERVARGLNTRVQRYDEVGKGTRVRRRAIKGLAQLPLVLLGRDVLVEGPMLGLQVPGLAPQLEKSSERRIERIEHGFHND